MERGRRKKEKEGEGELARLEKPAGVKVDEGRRGKRNEEEEARKRKEERSGEIKE